jgi:hypothetical protein
LASLMERIGGAPILLSPPTGPVSIVLAGEVLCDPPVLPPPAPQGSLSCGQSSDRAGARAPEAGSCRNGNPFSWRRLSDAGGAGRGRDPASAHGAGVLAARTDRLSIETKGCCRPRRCSAKMFVESAQAGDGPIRRRAAMPARASAGRISLRAAGRSSAEVYSSTH